jgi:pilus assembly protein CpaC
VNLNWTKQNWLKIALILGLLSSPSSQAWAQDKKGDTVADAAKPVAEKAMSKTVGEPDKGSDEDDLQADGHTKSDNQSMLFLPLYIGIETQEKLSKLPDNAIFKGDFKKVTRVSVSRETGTLLFSPIHEGVATLLIYDQKNRKIFEYRLDVKKSNLTKVAREIRSLLTDIEGITIKIVNNRVIVDGQILLPRDMNRIHSVLREYQGQADTLVTLSPIAQRKIAQVIQAEIGSPEISVHAINGVFVLEGVAEDEQAKKRAMYIAEAYVPDEVKTTAEMDNIVKPIGKSVHVIDLLTIKQAAPKDPGKIIQIVVHFVELNKDYSKSFNFDWSPGLDDKSGLQFTSSSGSASGSSTSITGTIYNLIPKLNWAKEHGHARVLQSTSLIIQDGQKGELQNTTSIPYPIAQANGVTSTGHDEIGIRTSISPKILNARSDSISMDLTFSVKEPAGTTGTGLMISNSEVHTLVIVRSGQSAAVGGLVSNTSSTDYNRVPAGSSSNPIFSLRASKAFTHKQSQFVVFVTPIIKASASQGSEKIKKKFRLRD